MAISKAHYQMLRELKRRGILPANPHLLEIGQANYYGDMDPREMLTDIDEFCADEPERMRDEIARIMIVRSPGDEELFRLADVVYQIFLQPKCRISIDMGGEEDSIRHDLNQYYFEATYDLVINHGTAEHIFNIAQVFHTMHDSAKIGGLMIHELPFIGWIDHGFYAVQPTLIYDLACANDYKIEFTALEDVSGQQFFEFTSREQLLDMVNAGGLPPNLLIYCALRNTTAAPFKIPMQGVYSNSISDKAKEAWVTMR